MVSWFRNMVLILLMHHFSCYSIPCVLWDPSLPRAYAKLHIVHDFVIELYGRLMAFCSRKQPTFMKAKKLGLYAVCIKLNLLVNE